MGNVILMPGMALASANDAPDTGADAPETKAKHDAFWAEVTKRFENRHSGRHVVPAYTKKCLKQVEQLMAYAGKGLVDIAEGDYEAWSAFLAKDLATSTLRTYQKHVRQVLNYVCNTDDLQASAAQTFGKKVPLFAHRYNSIVHVSANAAGRKKLRPMTHEELEDFFDGYERRIEEALAYQPRAVRALYRDKALFHLMYVNGLRISEIPEIDIDDWRKLTEAPQLGKYGQVRVIGKGARTSGPRTRFVPTTDASLAETMDWYERAVRPLYVVEGSTEKAFFLSEIGNRISTQTIYARFIEHVAYVGLAGHNFTPHTMRRNMVSHEGERSDMSMSQHKAGHASMATTIIYGQVAPEHQRKKAAKLVANQIDSITSEGQHAGP